ncbi:MAG: adenylate/guanylate cyclase domain-containing protein [Rhodospirillaceae bacterium]|nr:adenylate/guanylate cyclase domain-containing protein [Rhodospirillaceae bacterium]MBT7291053.1 adenylate/guanylate cyclase domain-containing protein [Rhodospirillaceae bacterium]
MARDTVQRRLAAILAADVVGWSRLMGADETGTLARLKGHRNELIDPKLAEFGGRIVKTTGDGVLVEFPSAVDAVKCASEIQEAMVGRNEGVPESTVMQFRIGINLGEIIIDTDGDIFGDGVNIAARLEELATPGSVNISEDVYRQILGRLDAGLHDLGQQNLKNIANPVRVYRVGESAGAASVAAVTQKSESLTTVGPTGFEARPAIAVLPFDNMSRDEDQEFFADGISEDLITALSLWRQFPVIARNSTFTYKGQKIDVKQVGKELGARYVLEGSVRKAGNRLRITAQLIDAESGAHVWAERFDRELEDIFDLQDEITESIVLNIMPEISMAETERAVRVPPANLDAWEYLQRGVWHVYRYTREDNEKAREYFLVALERDPSLSLAAAYSATVIVFEVLFGWTDKPQESLMEGMEYCRRAIALNPQESTAHSLMATILAISGEAERGHEAGKRAVELNPSSALAHFCCAFPLAYLRRYEEALAGAEQAIRLSPRDPLLPTFYVVQALAHLMLRQYDESITYSRRALQGQPDNIRALHRLAIAAAHMGDLDAARAAYQEAERVLPSPPREYFANTHAFTHEEDLEFLLEGLRLAGWQG